jgi:hypothetical protein
MLGGGDYPISVAELQTYTEDADKLFTEEAHERLKERLAFSPDTGDVILGTEGVRRLLWPHTDRRGRQREALVLYFFYDLNMPLFLLAVFADGECEFDDGWRSEMAELVKQLVAEYGKQWRARRKPRGQEEERD